MEWFVPTPDGRTLPVTDAGHRRRGPGRPAGAAARRHAGRPVSHGQWLAAHIPGVEAWFFEDEGHGLREKHIADIHGWLIDHGA